MILSYQKHARKTEKDVVPYEETNYLPHNAHNCNDPHASFCGILEWVV